MKPGQSIYPLLAVLLFFNLSYGQTKTVKEYLSVPGPLVFDNSTYILGWTSPAAGNYYKQEYIRKGDTVTRFNSMILLELLTGKAKPAELLANKLAELKTIQQGNPYSWYETVSSSTPGEYILDFLVTENAPGNQSIRIAERNIYRYRAYAGKTGQNGVVLFGISIRSYGNDCRKFMETNRINKKELQDKVKQAAFPLPAIKK